MFVLGGTADVFGTQFSGNTADEPGADIYNLDSTVSVYMTCPDGYGAAVQGGALDTAGDTKWVRDQDTGSYDIQEDEISGPLFSFSCGGEVSKRAQESEKSLRGRCCLRHLMDDVFDVIEQNPRPFATDHTTDSSFLRLVVLVQCDNTMSFVLVGVSLLSVAAIIYAVDLKAQQQGTMIGIKSITAFYQSAQLTTLVSIPWPKIALWTPFTIP
jgi:hypothetical protein